MSAGSWRRVITAQIRLEQRDDLVAVRETNEQAFGTTTEARLVDRLRGSADSISLVATVGNWVVGHILFTPVSIEPNINVRVAGLAPMAVRPEYQRAGIGSELIRAGLDQCRRRGYAAVVVVGHPEFYRRFGFKPGHTKGLKCEFPVPAEAFMALELIESALTGIAGLVRYRPEFAAE
jgi:putative acetyltransferase